MQECFMYGDVAADETDANAKLWALRREIERLRAGLDSQALTLDRTDRALQEAAQLAEERRREDNRAAAAVSMKRRKLGLSPIPPSEEYDVVQALDLGGGAEIHVVIYGTTEARAVARHMVGSAPLKL